MNRVCARVVRDPECSEERKEAADVPRDGSRTLDVIATEALLRFPITRNILKRKTRSSHLSVNERISDERDFNGRTFFFYGVLPFHGKIIYVAILFSI